MKIIIGSDHRGYDLKEKIKDNFKNIEWIDVGTDSKVRTDYPIYAQLACKKIVEGIADKAVLICGSGVGIAIAANRFRKIYAALCWNEMVARMAKEDDSCNVLVLPADFVTDQKAYEIIKAWLDAEFKEDLSYKRRLDMLDKF